MTETVFRDFFKKIASSAYTGLDIEHFLVKANGFLAAGLVDNNSKKDLFESSIELGETDIELYLRIMNFCKKNSLNHVNCILMRSSIYFLSNIYKEDISTLDRTYQQILCNVISIIMSNNLLEEIDIVVASSETMISLGKYPSIDVPCGIFSKYENKMFEIFNDKYTKKLLENEYSLESIELINIIRKINFVYTNFGRHISFSSKNYSYSESNSRKHFHSNLSPFDYDEQIYKKCKILLFPLISEIEISGEEIIFKNTGFGNLEKCNFKIIITRTNQIIDETSYDINSMGEDKYYITDTRKNIIRNLNLNENLDFRFEFEKFSRKHAFSFYKKIGMLKAEFDKPGDVYILKDSFNNNVGQQVNINSSNVTQKMISYSVDIEKLRKSFNELAELIDESDMAEPIKEEAKSNTNEAIQETTKEKWDSSKLIKIVNNLATLVGASDKLLSAVGKIKDYLGM